MRANIASEGRYGVCPLLCGFGVFAQINGIIMIDVVKGAAK